MKRILLLLAIASLAGCRATVPAIDASVAPNEPLKPESGAVLVEIVHMIGPRGSYIDRWNDVKLVEVNLKADAEAKIYSLDRVVELGSDTAVFAGVLPAGMYRLATFEGERDGPYSTMTYISGVPEGVGEFFIAGGKLNSLGLMLHQAVGHWTWVYRRDPGFDLRARVIELRPDLAASLGAPLSEPESENKDPDPETDIRRAFPTTPPLSLPDGSVVLGAQLGHIYRRNSAAGSGMGLHTWDAVSIETLQTITDLTHVSGSMVDALTADGRIFRVDLDDGSVSQVPVSAPGRIIGIGRSNGRDYAVTAHMNAEANPPEDAMRISIGQHEGGEQWSQLADIPAAREPASVVFLGDEVLLLLERERPKSNLLTRVKLSSGAVNSNAVAGKLLRHIGDDVLVTANGSARQPRNMQVSRDGGNTWESLAQLGEAGWPSLDEEGRLVVPGRLDKIAPSRDPLVLRETDGAIRWVEIGKFPVTCGQFIETAFAGGKFIAFCGERVFKLQGADYGWQKEALHELQSALK